MLKNRLMLPILAVIVGITASAFTTSTTNIKALMNNQQLEEWVFTGSSQNGENNNSLYVPSAQRPDIQCSQETDLVCKIMAPEDGTSGHPDLNAGNPRDNQQVYSTTFRAE